MEKIVLASGEIYHVFNRGIEERPTFIDKSGVIGRCKAITPGRSERSIIT